MDDVYDLLSDQQRRHTLLALLHKETPQRLPSLALYLDGVSEPTRGAERLYARLYHTHVPKLESFGLVEYHDDAELLELTENGKLLASAIDQ